MLSSRTAISAVRAGSLLLYAARVRRQSDAREGRTEQTGGVNEGEKRRASGRAYANSTGDVSSLSYVGLRTCARTWCPTVDSAQLPRPQSAAFVSRAVDCLSTWWAHLYGSEGIAQSDRKQLQLCQATELRESCLAASSRPTFPLSARAAAESARVASSITTIQAVDSLPALLTPFDTRMEPSSSSAGGEPKKKRAPLACSRCKSRKKRCDAELNPAGCSSCLTAGVGAFSRLCCCSPFSPHTSCANRTSSCAECRFIDPITQKEASRGYVRKLEEKIAALELALVAQGVPTLDHLDGASPALVDAHNARVEQSGTGDDDLCVSSLFALPPLLIISPRSGLGLLSLGATAEEGAAAPTAARVQPLQHFSLAAFFASEVKRPRGRSSAASPCAFPPSRCLSDLPNASVKLWLEAFIALSFAQFPLFDATFLRSLISRHRSLESSLPFHPHNRTVAVHLSVTYLVVAIGAASSGNCAVAAVRSYIPFFTGRG